MKNIPNKVYIQVGDECDFDVDFNKLAIDQLTHCFERVFENDLEYTNLDAVWHDEPLSEVQADDTMILVSISDVGFVLINTDAEAKVLHKTYGGAKELSIRWAYVDDLMPKGGKK